MSLNGHMAEVETSASWEHREAGENFPVALGVLPRGHREHLHAIYGYARFVDELGDSYAGDRVAALTDLREHVHALWRGEAPSVDVLRRLAPTVRACHLSEEPFQRLIEANLVDQTVTTYATFQDLVGYCRLSADPVGRMVLEVFGQSSPDRVALSDQVCTALQIVEHLQDVGEDRRAGRVYLPQESLSDYGVLDSDLDAPHASAALRRVVLAETDRAEAMFREGSRLVGELRGWARLAVAGFVAGGLATVAALRRTEGDVLSTLASPAKADVLKHALPLVLRGRA
jgi:squalene synthase HpnC